MGDRSGFGEFPGQFKELLWLNLAIRHPDELQVEKVYSDVNPFGKNLPKLLEARKKWMKKH